MRSLEEMLVSGSDSRLKVDTKTGLNRYGCSPAPCLDTHSFSSSTASSISPEAFRRVQAEYESFQTASCPKRKLDTQMETLRQNLKRILGLPDTETEIVFSPSGTDSTLHALSLIHALTGSLALDCLLTASDETGSGVPLALSGRHFSDRTSEGISVTPGEGIAGLGGEVTLISLPRRSAGGVLRPPSCLDQDIWEAAEHSAAAGRPVLLQVMDSSKLGASGPSAECLRHIQRRFSGLVYVIVDACQMRLSRERLKSHLDQGHFVLSSGSKFFTGPPFSGALLVPSAFATKLKTLPLSAPGLRDYTSRNAWPSSWTALRGSLPNRVNFGQYFRWTAALVEMEAYFAVPLEFRRRVLAEFETLTTALIQNQAPDFLLLEANHSAEHQDGSEMDARTIFPFLVRHDSRWMSYADTTTLYQALTAAHCHVGQPVRIPLRDGQDAGALRICADARLVSQLWADAQTNPRTVGLASQRQQICEILAAARLAAQQIGSAA
jgi:hypothetical protein